eukprot:8411312-Pyramimonas_sp.AAC.2
MLHRPNAAKARHLLTKVLDAAVTSTCPQLCSLRGHPRADRPLAQRTQATSVQPEPNAEVRTQELLQTSLGV